MECWEQSLIDIKWNHFPSVGLLIYKVVESFFVCCKSWRREQALGKFQLIYIYTWTDGYCSEQREIFVEKQSWSLSFHLLAIVLRLGERKSRWRIDTQNNLFMVHDIFIFVRLKVLTLSVREQKQLGSFRSSLRRHPVGVLCSEIISAQPAQFTFPRKQFKIA